MKHFIIDLFKIETKPRKGLLALEWAVLAYLVLTTLVILFTYTRLENPESMLWGRLTDLCHANSHNLHEC